MLFLILVVLFSFIFLNFDFWKFEKNEKLFILEKSVDIKLNLNNMML